MVVGNNGGKATNVDDLWQKLWKLWQQLPAKSEIQVVGISDFQGVAGKIKKNRRANYI